MPAILQPGDHDLTPGQIEKLREYGVDLDALFQLSPERQALAAATKALAVDPEEECMNCEHPASMHAGDGNEGACTANGCDCEAMEVNADPASEETASAEEPTTLGTDEVIERAAAELVRSFQLKLEQFKVETASDTEVESLPESPAASGGGMRWTALIVPEATLTDDGRAFAPGAVSWRELPLTLAAMLDTPHADVVTESRACGRIDEIYRQGRIVYAAGVFDTGEFGQEIARMVGDGTLRGISVDIAVHESEVAPKADFFDEDGNWREERIETSDPDADFLDILFGEGDPPIFVVTAGVIGAVTVCPFPAFADAKIEVASSLRASSAPNVWTVTQQHGMVVTGTETETPVEEALPAPVVTASAEGIAPLKPPAAWFEDPGLAELTALTVTDDGHVYGHAAAWGTCHIAIPDVCTTAPRSETDYANFHLKQVIATTELDGEEVDVRIPCGTITLDTGHAGKGLGAQAATSHYDNTGVAVADVVVGEDEFGIWFSGALRSDVDAEKARKLQGAVLSGDWRAVEMEGGERNLELVALLAVNVPGFPVPRTRALVAAGDDGMEVVALVAAGIHIGVSEEERLDKIRALREVAHLDTGAFQALLERAKAA